MKIVKRTLAVLLTLLMLISAVPLGVMNVSATYDKYEASEIRRDIVNHMFQMATIQWTAGKSMNLPNGSSVTPIKKGKTYYGIPYRNWVSDGKGGADVASLKEFNDYKTKHNGYIDKDLGQNDCTTAIGLSYTYAFEKRGAKFPFTNSSNIYYCPGHYNFIKVGNYSYVEEKDKNNNPSANESSKSTCKKNGKETMYAAYASCYPGDVLICWHAMMVIAVDKANKKVKVTHQSGAYLSYNAKENKTSSSNKNDMNTTWRVNQWVKFEDLYNEYHCIPTRYKSLDQPYVTTANITFDANGGSVNPTNKTYNVGDTFSSFPTPTRKGYKFSGWYTAKSGGTKITTSSKVEKAITLYAHWTSNKIENAEITASSTKLTDSNINVSGLVTVKTGDITLKYNTDYTLSPSTVKNIGKHTITVKGKGNYSGSKKTTVTITPKTPTLKTVEIATAQKGYDLVKALLIKCVPVNDCDKQEFQISKTSDFKTAYTLTVENFKKDKTNKYVKPDMLYYITDITLNGQKESIAENNYYYVRARAYKTVSGNKIYGSWGATKSYTPPVKVPTVKVWTNANEIGTINAKVQMQVSNPDGLLITRRGVEIRKKGETNWTKPSGNGKGYDDLKNRKDKTIPGNFEFGSGKEFNYALSPGITYEYRCYCVYNGTNYYSSVSSFTTKSDYNVSIKLQNPSDITTSSAVVNFVIMNPDQYEITDRGVDIRVKGAASFEKSYNEHIAGKKYCKQKTIQSYFTFGSGKEINYALQPGTTYEYKIYATCGGKKYYSGVTTFTTKGTSTTSTVTFNGNGGTPSSTKESFTIGQIYGDKMPSATKEGYAFNGWFTAANGGTRQIRSTTVTSGNKTLYAQWIKADEIVYAEKSDTIGIIEGRSYRIFNKNSGLALTANGVDSTAHVTQRARAEDKNQVWFVRFSEDGDLRFVNYASLKGLEMDANNLYGYGNALQINEPSNTDSQTFSFVQRGSDNSHIYYSMHVKSSGRVVDVAGASKDAGAELHQWDYHGGDNQLFYFEEFTMDQLDEPDDPTPDLTPEKPKASWIYSDVTNLTQTNARISGRIAFNPTTTCVESGFYLGTSSDSLTKNAKHDSFNMNIGSSSVFMGFTMSDYGQTLKAGTTYYYKFYIKDKAGNEYQSAVKSFTTKSPTTTPDLTPTKAKDTWTYSDVTNLTQTNARISGRIAFNPTTTCVESGFYLGTSSDSLTKNAKHDSFNMNIGSSSVLMGFTMSDYGQTLKAGTTYYYKFYIKDKVGNEYQSAVKSFTTKPPTTTPDPTPTKPKDTWTYSDVTNLTQTNARISGRIAFNPTTTCVESGFYLGTSSGSLAKNAKHDSFNMNIGSSSAFMGFTMSDYGQTLKAGTTYYYKFYIKDKAGNEYQSAVKSFTTKKDSKPTPTWTYSGVSKLSKTNARISGRIAFNPTTTCVESGFYLGTSSDSLKKNAKHDSFNMNIGSSSVFMGFTMSDYGQTLKAGTTYYYKFYIKDKAGNEYQSAVKSFTTSK